MPAFVGREREVRLLRARHVEAAAGRPQTLIVEGAAGVGKTSLVRAFTSTLEPDSVLTASGDEGERFLRFGVVEQLLGVRREWPDAFSAGADILQSLDEHQGGPPVVFVVDDAHLADAESMAALTFTLRRLRADRVMAILSVRTEETGRLPAGLLKLSDSQDSRIRLDGLGDEDVVALGSALGHGRLSGRSARRLRQHTGGNSLYLQALMRELSTEVLEAPDPLPAPESHAGLVLGAVAARSEDACDLVRAASVIADGSALTTVAAIAEIARPEQALDELSSAQLLTCEYSDDGWHVSFAHPLVRAAVYDDLGPLERQRLHHLAAAGSGGDESLLHRLAAASGTDPGLAAELAARAQQLQEAGDLRAAADFFLKAGHAAGADGSSWLLEAATIFLIAGDVSAAKGVEESLDPLVGGAMRAHLQARLAWFGGGAGSALDLASAAWERGDELNDRVGASWRRSSLSCTTCKVTGLRQRSGRSVPSPRTCRQTWPIPRRRRGRWVWSSPVSPPVLWRPSPRSRPTRRTSGRTDTTS